MIMLVYRIVSIILTIILGVINIFATEKIYIKDIETDFSSYSYNNYEKLLKAHITAIQEHKEIDYSGIDTIRMNIPTSAVSIPLPDIIDFKNVVFIVNNKEKDITLFELSRELKPIYISEKISSKYKFSLIDSLINRKVLFVIIDKNPWVSERKGYNSRHIRRDIVVIKNGSASNGTIQPYNNEDSNPEYFYRNATNDSIRISNLIFNRTKQSTCKTFCIKIQNASNIELNNISIQTPESNLFGDAILTFINCADVVLQNIYIKGTYSQKDKYGYGIAMDNVFDSRFYNIYGDGNWGIFGTNNLNQVYIQDSNINRFDIHCYGKDVYCKNTHFRNLYNQFSSFYGDLIFEDCLFTHFVPVLIEDSYSAYTRFNISFLNCMVQVNPQYPYLINMGQSRFLIDCIRPELGKLEWPNLNIHNLNISGSSDTDTYTLYHTTTNSPVFLDNLPKIVINNLFDNFVTMKTSNSFVNTMSSKKINDSKFNSKIH